MVSRLRERCGRAAHGRLGARASGPPRARLTWGWALLLVLAATLPHLGTLSAGFAYDDHSIVLENAAVQDGRFDRTFEHAWPRATRELSLALDHALFGNDPTGYHAQSLLWHVACVLLLYALLARVGLSAPAAAFGAALFAVHPVHVESIANVANRKELLHTAFSLAALLAWMRALDVRGRRRGAWVAASAALWITALLSKQVAVAVPFLAAAYELLLRPREGRILLRHPARIALAAAAGGVILAAFLIRTLDLSDPSGIETFAGYEGTATWGAAALTAARAFWRSMGLVLWPAGLCPDHVVPLSSSLFEPATAFAWTGLAALAAAALAVARRAPALAFSVAWVGLSYLPVSNLVPSAYVLADRYLYLPSIGLCLAVAWLAERLVARARTRWPHLAPDAPRMAWAAALGLVALLGARSVAYAAHWQDEEALWRHTAVCEPRSWRAHNNVGVFELQAGHDERAIAHFDAALARRPTLAAARYNRANALYALGRYEAALRDYDAAVAGDPTRAEPYYNRGNALFALERMDEARADYDRAIERDPRNPDFYVNRGRAQLALGAVDRAIADWQRAIELDPEHAVARYNLAAALELRGEHGAAREQLVVAARLGLAAARERLGALPR